MRNPLAAVIEKTYGPLPKSDDDDVHVMAIVKGAERFVFLFDFAHRAEMLRVLGRFASNPELSFTWADAAILSQKVNSIQ
jgi:hypothetical protein